MCGEHGDGLVRSDFNRELFGPECTRRSGRSRRCSTPRTPQPRQDRRFAVDAEHLRDAERPEPGPLRTRLRFDVVGGMFGAADRCMNIGAVPQVDDRHDVSFVHRDPGRGALHSWPGQGAGEGAQRRRSPRRAGRRTTARGAGSVPRVQGVQERMPAGRRHRCDEERGARRQARRPRCPGALPYLRRHPPAEPAGRRHRPAVEPAWQGGPAAGPDGQPPRHCPAAEAARVPAHHPAALVPRTRRRRGRRRRSDAGDRDAARRLVHQLHRAGDRPGRRRTARAGGIPGRAPEQRMLRPRRASRRVCWTTPGRRPAHWPPRWPGTPSPAHPSWAASRPAF